MVDDFLPSGVSVLLVDDEREQLDALEALLSGIGIHADRANSLDSAVELVTRRHYDVVVTDMYLSPGSKGEDGIQLIRAAKAASPRTEIVAVTKQETVDTARSALLEGASAYVVRVEKSKRWEGKFLRTMRRVLARMRRRLTRIVATIGPASGTPEALRELFASGVDVARINCSQVKDESELEERFAAVRDVDATVAVLMDLPGPKIRLGEFSVSVVTLEKGQEFVLTSREVLGDGKQASVLYRKLPEEIEPGQIIFINDGIVKLQAISIENGTDIRCIVLAGGPIMRRKGVNVPYAELGERVPTQADRRWLRSAVGLRADFIAVSFVESARDIEDVRSIVEELGGSIPLIAKVERPEAVEREILESIIAVSDGVMVARGDLAVETPPEEVPALQREIISLCVSACKPVICATQMLLSMTTSPVPTRAETGDVFTAVSQGVDAVMLSEETATGEHPPLVVNTLSRIAKSGEVRCEPAVLGSSRSGGETAREVASDPEAIADAAAALFYAAASAGSAPAAFVVRSSSGSLARLLTRRRLPAPIIIPAFSDADVRRWRLTRGVVPVRVKPGTVSNDEDRKGASLGVTGIVPRVSPEMLRRAGVRAGVMAEQDAVVVISAKTTKVQESGATRVRLQLGIDRPANEGSRISDC